MLTKGQVSLATAFLVLLSACGDTSSAADAQRSSKADDPVRIADKRSGLKMTERDVIAFANLHHFAKTGSAPRHHDLSRDQIDRLTSILDRALSKSGSRMPRAYAESAELWANIQRSWSDLSTDERMDAREFADTMTRADLLAQTAHTHDHSGHSHSGNDRSGHDHSSHDHSSHDHHHSHAGHDHGGQSSSKSSRRSAPAKRYDPAAVSAEIGNAPIAVDSIFPP
jgi:hypothetical protein